MAIMETGETSGGPQRPFKPRMLGLCFKCGAYGHIAKFCDAPRRPYPFTQPAGSSTGYAESLPCCSSVDGFEVMSKVCVDVTALDHGTTVKEGVDRPPAEQVSNCTFRDQVAWGEGTA